MTPVDKFLPRFIKESPGSPSQESSLPPPPRAAQMPVEIKSKEEFEKAMESATEVRVHRTGDSAKVKIRTKEGLLTFKTTSEEADSMVKGTKLPVVET
jgi:hypothetical protein